MSKFEAVLSKQSTARGKADYLQLLADIEAAKETRPELEDMETITAADVGIVITRKDAPKGSSRHPVDTWSTDPDGARKHAERHAIDHGPTNHLGDLVNCLDWSD
tara:strand:+ start:311 stop:625 length:315 start_codon:yes stop_codon:yes gene_type:complete